MPLSPPAPRGDLAARVVAWQERHGRQGLPWQGTRDPYRVWLSEVMLQQTQVATVIGYYARFLDRFADVAALAAAPLDEVLALWSGLGYYSRARNLHRCAQAVVRDHGGVFPRDSATLATLPGIGRSTAAAIAAFCSGERVAILDGNVKRVLARVLAFEGDLAQPSQERALWGLAQALVPAKGVERYTQGMMDLGATVCTRRAPRCDACPLTGLCAAQASDRTEKFPVRSRKVRRTQRRSALLWLEQAGCVYLVRRPEAGVWAGLWSLPEWAEPEALQALAEGWPGAGGWLEPVAHALTHFDWRLEPWRHALPARLSAGVRRLLAEALPEGRWYAYEEALALGLPAPVRRLLEGA